MGRELGKTTAIVHFTTQATHTCQVYSAHFQTKLTKIAVYTKPPETLNETQPLQLPHQERNL